LWSDSKSSSRITPIQNLNALITSHHRPQWSNLLHLLLDHRVTLKLHLRKARYPTCIVSLQALLLDRRRGLSLRSKYRALTDHRRRYRTLVDHIQDLLSFVGRTNDNHPFRNNNKHLESLLPVVLAHRSPCPDQVPHLVRRDPVHLAILSRMLRLQDKRIVRISMLRLEQRPRIASRDRVHLALQVRLPCLRDKEMVSISMFRDQMVRAVLCSKSLGLRRDRTHLSHIGHLSRVR
jgi:hypothetical protein